MLGIFFTVHFARRHACWDAATRLRCCLEQMWAYHIQSLTSPQALCSTKPVTFLCFLLKPKYPKKRCHFSTTIHSALSLSTRLSGLKCLLFHLLVSPRTALSQLHLCARSPVLFAQPIQLTVWTYL